MLDGVYTGFDKTSARALTFHPAKKLTNDEVTWMVRHIAVLINGHLCRRGFLDEDHALVDDSGADLDEQATHQAAAIQGLIPFGPRAGCQALLFEDERPTRVPPPTKKKKKKLCADVDGYSLHAAVCVGESGRSRLEKICRYLARPALAQDRLSIANNGHIVYRFRKTWRNGKTAVVLDPMTFLSRLAAQVPPPRFHMLTYHGVLAPAAARRDEIVPGHGEDDGGAVRRCDAESSKPGADGAVEQGSRPQRMSWADLVRRVWLVEILRCECGGRRKVLAMVFDPKAIERVLTHMGLPYSRPERAPPRPMPGALPFSDC